MSLMFEPLRKYAVFSGRARRTEYWLFHLFLAIVELALLAWMLISASANAVRQSDVIVTDYSYFQQVTTSGSPSFWPFMFLLIFGLFMFLPALAVSVRRLHDADFSGWWILITLIPGGALVLFIFFLIDGTRGRNRFGADPKGRTPINLPS